MTHRSARSDGFSAICQQSSTSPMPYTEYIVQSTRPRTRWPESPEFGAIHFQRCFAWGRTHHQNDNCPLERMDRSHAAHLPAANPNRGRVPFCCRWGSGAGEGEPKMVRKCRRPETSLGPMQRPYRATGTRRFCGVASVPEISAEYIVFIGLIFSFSVGTSHENLDQRKLHAF